MAPSQVVIAASRIAVGLIYAILNLILPICLTLWDLSLTLWNLVAPLRPADRVVPQGRPGANGLWPEYIAPTEKDSRSCCPFLNAMANHGILPRDGRNISFRDLNTRCHETFNFSPTFSFYVPHYAATMLERNYWTDTFDLADLSAHNCIEHDASLCREDTYHNADQSKPSARLIEELLESASGPDGTLTKGDVSRMLSKRRAESKRTNGQYSQAMIHKIFGASNASTLLTICGGRVKDLYPMLLEERIPDGWQPRVRNPGGLTLTTFQFTVLPVELGVREEVRETLELLHMGSIRDD
ncbi:Cloroperoxidase [Fomitopsis betulina]|nr:Cloroperoxidase [Fomitopsis betulina]